MGYPAEDWFRFRFFFGGILPSFLECNVKLGRTVNGTLHDALHRCGEHGHSSQITVHI